jgi:hypothetical protein
MSSRVKKAKSGGKSPKSPPDGRRALRRVRGLISKNRLTVGRIQRMKPAELLTLATVLKAAHDVSDNAEEKQNIRTIVAFVNQTAQEQAQYGK